MIKKIEDFKSERFENCVTMLVQTRDCASCNKLMIEKERGRNIFPAYYLANQESQAKAAGYVFESDATLDGEKICTECKESGKASFTCNLCCESKPAGKLKKSIGTLDTDCLCSDCYSSVSAEIWDDTVRALEDEHRWDNE